MVGIAVDMMVLSYGRGQGVLRLDDGGATNQRDKVHGKIQGEHDNSYYFRARVLILVFLALISFLNVDLFTFIYGLWDVIGNESVLV